MKSILAGIMASLIFGMLSGCSTKPSDELSTGEIEAKFEVYISDKKESVESNIKVEAVMKTTDLEGEISFVSLSDNDSLRVKYKGVEKNIIENYMAPGLYSVDYIGPVLDNDFIDIEFFHHNRSIISSINFGILPELISEEEVTLPIDDTLSLSWINNSAKINNIYISGPCYSFKVIELGLEESSYTINLDELEVRVTSNSDTCTGEAKLEWKVLGDINSEFDSGEVTAYISKVVTFNIE